MRKKMHSLTHPIVFKTPVRGRFSWMVGIEWGMTEKDLIYRQKFNKEKYSSLSSMEQTTQHINTLVSAACIWDFVLLVTTNS